MIGSMPPISSRSTPRIRRPGERRPFVLFARTVSGTILFLVLAWSVGWGAPPGGVREEDPMDLAQLVPERLGNWKSGGRDGLYDRQTIFRYMDGAGEVYLSFAFRRLLVRTFVRGEDGAVVELYDMGNAADAFGIFCRNRQGEDAGIGQGSEYRSGYLVFWKGRYFATVYATRETDATQEAVFDLARAVSSRISEEGALPALVSLLPRAGLISASVRYFHRHTDLNQHYFVSDENLLGLNGETEAVLANYEEVDLPIYLLIVRYPSVERAVLAYSAYAGAFLSGDEDRDEDRPAGRLEDKTFTAGSQDDSYLIAVFDAPTLERAEDLVFLVREQIGGADE